MKDGQPQRSDVRLFMQFLAFGGCPDVRPLAAALAKADVAGVFEPGPVQNLWKKCQARADESQFSNSDNMAVVGVLSTQLLYRRLIATQPHSHAIELRTLVERE